MSDERKFRAPKSDIRPTPQERLDVARRLRVIGSEPQGSRMLRDVVNVVSGDRRSSTVDFALALADLIDPTCTITGSFEDEREAGFSRYGVHVYRLSCGHKFDWQLNEPPSYCPACGSRIEWEDK